MFETPPGHPDLLLTSNPSIYSSLSLSLSLLSTNGGWRTVTLACITTSRASTPFPSVLLQNSGWTPVDSLSRFACRQTWYTFPPVLLRILMDLTSYSYTVFQLQAKTLQLHNYLIILILIIIIIIKINMPTLQFTSWNLN